MSERSNNRSLTSIPSPTAVNINRRLAVGLTNRCSLERNDVARMLTAHRRWTLGHFIGIYDKFVVFQRSLTRAFHACNLVGFTCVIGGQTVPGTIRECPFVAFAVNIFEELR